MTAGLVPVQKDDTKVFIDLAANTLLPNGNQAEKWEGLTIGPRLFGGGHVIVAGNDNDYSVTQTGSGTQFDVYVDYKGNFARCPLDATSNCEVTIGVVTTVAPTLPTGFSLLPGMLHAYRASANDLEDYVPPRHWIFTILFGLF